jgi:hypothetical protein
MTTWHNYGYEIWPDPMPTASYPMLIPDRVILYVRGDARELPTVGEGFSAQRVQHNRYHCHPPCSVRRPPLTRNAQGEQVLNP